MSQSGPSVDSARTISVRSPCRLHFGLFSFGQPTGPRYGGVGAMIEPPAVEVAVRSADSFMVTGTLAARAEQFAQTVAKGWKLDSLPKCHLEVHCPPDHTGLGVGTQLALAVAAALRRFLELPALSADELAMSVGRGVRSAIGTHGFQHGGLIVDAGMQPGERLGKLMHRLALPAAWRFVLVRGGDDRGLAGASEVEAFDQLPPVPAETTQALRQITDDAMLPAVERADCDAFGEAVYQFGLLAGECFAAVQNGPFASLAIARLVEALRAHGIAGVGQSSWGPTVFACVPDDAQAHSLVDWLHNQCRIAPSHVVVAQPNNRGAQFSTL